MRVTVMNERLMVDVRQLRVGLHVQLDLGWLDHPFARSSFRIDSEQQLQKLRDVTLIRNK